MGNNSKTVQESLSKSGCIIIDVRTPGEFSSGHHPDAMNLPLAELDTADEKLPKEKSTPIILYCRSGGRATSALNILTAKGFTDVVNAGGLSDITEICKQKN